MFQSLRSKLWFFFGTFETCNITFYRKKAGHSCIIQYIVILFKALFELKVLLNLAIRINVHDFPQTESQSSTNQTTN